MLIASRNSVKVNIVYSVSMSLVVVTTAHLNSTKPELRLCACSYPARGASESRDGEDL